MEGISTIHFQLQRNEGEERGPPRWEGEHLKHKELVVTGEGEMFHLIHFFISCFIATLATGKTLPDLAEQGVHSAGSLKNSVVLDGFLGISLPMPCGGLTFSSPFSFISLPHFNKKKRKRKMNRVSLNPKPQYLPAFKIPGTHLYSPLPLKSGFSSPSSAIMFLDTLVTF